MPENKPAYDLFVLIDPEVPDERRAGMVEEIKKRISSGDGLLKGDVDWGTRRLAYEIDHRSDAYYHLFQFEASSDLLKTLDRSLAIDDGVLRHRIMRLPKGAPDEPPKAPPARQAEPAREGKHGRRAAAAPVGDESGTPPEEGESATPAPRGDESAKPAPRGDESATPAPSSDESATPAPAENEASAGAPAGDESKSPPPTGGESPASTSSSPGADEPATSDN
jgi:small subunit ribosomal protein S6